MKEVTASPKPIYATAPYILGVMVFTRLCFWILAYTKGMSLTEDLCRWDCGWYIQLAENGYDLQPHDNFKKDAANWAFFPFFPLLLAISHHLLAIPYRIAGFLIANIAMFFAIRLSLRYLHRTRPKVAGPFWVWFCISGPYSFYLANGYSEALFWVLGCAALLMWTQKKYLQAGGLTALLCALFFSALSSRDAAAGSRAVSFGLRIQGYQCRRTCIPDFERRVGRARDDGLARRQDHRLRLVRPDASALCCAKRFCKFWVVIPM